MDDMGHTMMREMQRAATPNRLFTTAAMYAHCPAGEPTAIVAAARKVFLTSWEEMAVMRLPEEVDEYFTTIRERLDACPNVTAPEASYLTLHLDAYFEKRSRA